MTDSSAVRVKPAKASSMRRILLRTKFICILPSGATQVVPGREETALARLGVQARDLRLLDGQTPSPVAILCRERALICNLLFVKAIIAADRALFLDSEDLRAAGVLQELQRRLRDHSEAVPASAMTSNRLTSLPEEDASQLSCTRAQTSDSRSSSQTAEGADHNPSVHATDGPAMQDPNSTRPPQFELCVLEAMLEHIALHLERAFQQVESVAGPGLPALRVKVSQTRLEWLRRLRMDIAQLSTTVTSFREVLSRLLDNDAEMRHMNLSARRSQYDHKHRRSLDGVGNAHVDFESPRQREKTVRDGRDKEQVEQLLETYYIDVSDTHNKLQALCESTADTASFVCFDLTINRNSVIMWRVTLLFFVSWASALSALYSTLNMNLGKAAGWLDSHDIFLETVFVTIFGSLAVTMAAIVYYAWKRVLFR